MKNDSKEQAEAYNKFAEQMTIATSTNGFLFSYFGISFALLMIFGISLSCISLGLIGGLWLMSSVFDPAYQLIIRLFRLKELPPYFVRPPTSRAIFLCIMLVIPGFLVFFGVQGLLGGYGPLNFSLVYELIRFFFF